MKRSTIPKLGPRRHKTVHQPMWTILSGYMRPALYIQCRSSWIISLTSHNVRHASPKYMISEQICWISFVLFPLMDMGYTEGFSIKCNKIQDAPIGGRSSFPSPCTWRRPSGSSLGSRRRARVRVPGPWRARCRTWAHSWASGIPIHEFLQVVWILVSGVLFLLLLIASDSDSQVLTELTTEFLHLLGPLFWGRLNIDFI